MAINMKTNDEIRTRFKELSETVFDSVNDMAAESGVDQKSLDKFIKGESKGINTTTLLKILARLGGEIVLPGDIKPAVCDMGDYAMIPKVKAKLGAGFLFADYLPRSSRTGGFFLSVVRTFFQISLDSLGLFS